MVGSGDINAGKIGAKGKLPSTDINIKKAQEEAQKPSKSDKKANFEKTSKENKSVFNKPAESQNVQANREGSKLSADQKNLEVKKQNIKGQDLKFTPSGLNKDYEIKNVKAKADLEALNMPKRPKEGKAEKGNKKKPPKMSLRTKLMPKRPINPKKPLPDIPGRLKSTTVNDPKKQLSDAVEILNQRQAFEDPNLISQYAKKLLKSGMDIQNKSLSALFNFDESIVDLDMEALRMLAETKLASTELSEELKLMLGEAFNQISQSETQTLKPFIQLFFPLPFPFMFLEIDEEFWRDDEELSLDEDTEEDSEDEDEEEHEDEFNAETEAKIAINTLNYGKLHMHLKYDSKESRFKLSVKGDEIAQELIDIVESNLDLGLEGSELSQNQLKAWHDNVLRITESRTLQINSEGKLDKEFLKACNIILKSIADNDKGSNDKNIEAEYKVL